MTLAELKVRIAAEPPVSRGEIEYRLAQLIRRDKPSVGAIALWLRLHPVDEVEGDPFAEFLAR